MDFFGRNMVVAGSNQYMLLHWHICWFDECKQDATVGKVGVKTLW